MSYGNCGMKPRLTPPILPSVDVFEVLRAAPIGTKAPCIIGGHWTKVERGWQAMGGDVFPRPGGDWTGELIYPST